MIEHALGHLKIAGVEEGTQLHRDVMELIGVFSKQNHDVVPIHLSSGIFHRIAKGENLIAKSVSDQILDLSSLLENEPKWKKFLLGKFSKDTFYDFPEDVRNQSAMWRMSSYGQFVSDVLVSNGYEAASLLSMLFQPKVVVEFGLHAGFTTLVLCKLNSDARIYGVDVNSKIPDADFPIGYAAWMARVNNLTVAVMNSWEFDMTGKVDLCFIDGEHCGDAPWKDSLRAWENRNQGGDWCIAWDDYHPNNPDVKSAVDRFVSEVAKMPLNKTHSWVWIGTKDLGELEKFRKP